MKIRKGFVSNSSSTSFVIDYWEDDKKERQSLKQIKETIDRIITAYNVIKQTDIKKDGILTIVKIDDETIDQRIEHESDYDWEGDKHKRLPPTKERQDDIKKQKGKYIINSEDENSIPYIIQELIESELRAEKWHWG